MAGERVLAIQECPDEVVQVVGMAVNDSSGLASGQDIRVFNAERDTIVDTAFFWWKVPDGSSGTVALQIDGVTISNVLDVTTAIDTVNEFVLDREKNLIPAGSDLRLLISAAGELEFSYLQLRLRSRIR